MTAAGLIRAEPPEWAEPFGQCGLEYFHKGWRPMAMGRNQKHPPPNGYTGNHGMPIDLAQVEKWARQNPEGNLGLVMPDHVIGIDVDHYDDKRGGDTLRQLTERLGPLPPTAISTSRSDGVSGIRFFQVPEGMHWKGVAGPDVEVVQRVHRYAVVWPSRHPNGGRYHWYYGGLDGMPWELVDDVPDPAKLPPLPPSWLEELTQGAYTAPPRAVDFSPADTEGVLTYGDPCPAMQKALSKYTGHGGRHDSMLTAVLAVVRCGEQGHLGAYAAIEQLRSSFTADIAGTRADGDAEFDRALDGAIGDVLAAPTAPEDKGCCGLGKDVPSVTVLEEAADVRVKVEPIPLHDAHEVFKKWLGKDYDRDALNASLSAAAVERLGGDPLWLLVISGPGNAKTETVQSLAGTGAIITSTIASEGALLSGTSKREQAKNATGGLLRKIGKRGVLVIKDVTSIISVSRDARAQVLAALREVYDGQWHREVGVDGGRTLSWIGRIVVVGAVTTAWDRAHDVTAAMGDRFVLVRMDSADKTTRQAAGRKAIGNVDLELQMREELAAAAGGVIAGMRTMVEPVSEGEVDYLLAAADLVTLARTGVDFDYRGDVIDAHAPEMPTRFAKQLAQVIRGGVAIGLYRSEALRLAIRCARDSMPPLRLSIIDDVAEHPGSTPSDTRRRLNKPWSTIDRQMQALHMLGVLDVDEVEDTAGKTRWRYSLADGIDPKALNPSPDLAPPPHKHTEEEQNQVSGVSLKGGAKSGEGNESGQLFHTCQLCPAGLWHSESQRRGICERCYRAQQGAPS
jgi:hypothetical protein